MKVLLIGSVLFLLTLTVLGWAKRQLPDPKPPAQRFHIKEAILQETASNACDVRQFFEADLLFIVGYTSLGIGLCLWVARGAASSAILALSLLAFAAVVDAIGDVVCIRYASAVIKNLAAESPQTFLHSLTNGKWTLVAASIISFLFASFRYWVARPGAA